MLASGDILRFYVARHNEGVRTGDFRPLLDLFHADGELVFQGMALGPFRGREAIGEALRSHPPGDEIVLARMTADAAGATGWYRWRGTPDGPGGLLELEVEGGLIRRLTVRVGKPGPQ